jgi:hypothetical protein
MLTRDREGLYTHFAFLAATMTTGLAAGCKRDRMAAPLATEPLTGYSDDDDGTLRGLPG